MHEGDACPSIMPRRLTEICSMCRRDSGLRFTGQSSRVSSRVVTAMVPSGPLEPLQHTWKRANGVCVFEDMPLRTSEVVM